MRLTFRSKVLAARLDSIRRDMTGRVLSAIVRVPPDLQWWYFQEFGTATHLQSGDAEYGVDASSHPDGYEIKPVTGHGIKLPDVGSGATVVPYVGFPFTAMHPGVTPKAFVRRVLQDIRTQTSDVVARTLIDSGFDFSALKQAFIAEAMPTVINTIGNSIAESLPNTRVDGKLGGMSAQDAFTAGAEIVETS